MKDHWLDEAKKKLAEAPKEPYDVSFDRLKAQGLIDDQGRVTGHIRRWDAFLAVTAVKYESGGKKLSFCRCLMPAFGMVGGASIDIRRVSIVADLKEKKKIVTAIWDDRLKIWNEGPELCLNRNQFLRVDDKEVSQDSLGELPEFQNVHSSF